MQRAAQSCSRQQCQTLGSLASDKCLWREAKGAEEKKDHNLSDGYQPASRSRFPFVSHDLLAWYFHHHGSITVSLWPLHPLLLPPDPPTRLPCRLFYAGMSKGADKKWKRGMRREERRSAARVTGDFSAAIHFSYLHNIPCSTIKMNFGGRLFLKHCLQGYFDWSVHTRIEEMLHNCRHTIQNWKSVLKELTCESCERHNDIVTDFWENTFLGFIFPLLFVLFLSVAVITVFFVFRDCSHEIFIDQLWGAANWGSWWDRW